MMVHLGICFRLQALQFRRSIQSRDNGPKVPKTLYHRHGHFTHLSNFPYLARLLRDADMVSLIQVETVAKVRAGAKFKCLRFLY